MVAQVALEQHTSLTTLSIADCGITDGGKEIHRLLLESNKVLKVSKGAPAWRSYGATTSPVAETSRPERFFMSGRIT